MTEAPSSSRAAIQTDRAPAAVGPYSQAVRSGALVFTAGQIGLDPMAGSLVSGGVVAETAQALSNLEAVLVAGGSSLAGVVKTTVFLADMGEFADMNDVYASRFGHAPPARSTVQAAALPLGARVEIDAVAVADPLPS